MARFYASHLRRKRAVFRLVQQDAFGKFEFRVSADADVDPSTLNLDDILSNADRNTLSDDRLFQFLLSREGDHRIGREKHGREKGDHISRTMHLYMDVNGKRENGLITCSNTYGLSAVTACPNPEKYFFEASRCLESIAAENGFAIAVEIARQDIQREEICTWIPNDDDDKVLDNIPTLIRYCETPAWSVDKHSDENWILIRDLALSFPKLNPAHGFTYKGLVGLDVKFYKTDSKNQPKKLEFQISIPRKKRVGKYSSFISEELWTGAIRHSALVLMDSFLEFCGVSSTVVSTAQASQVLPLERMPYHRTIVNDLHHLKKRREHINKRGFIERIADLAAPGLDGGKGDGKAVRDLAKSFLAVERDWIAFDDSFHNLIVDDSSDHIREIVARLKPNRSNLHYTENGEKKKTSSSRYRRVLNDHLIDKAKFVEQRLYSRHPALLRMTDKIFGLHRI